MLDALQRISPHSKHLNKIEATHLRPFVKRAQVRAQRHVVLEVGRFRSDGL